MSWHQHTWNILSVWKRFVAIFGCCILKNDNAHGCHLFLAAEDQKIKKRKNKTFDDPGLTSSVLPCHLQLLPLWMTPVFFFFLFVFIKSPHGCTIQTSVLNSHEGEYLQSDSSQMKSPPACCLVWNSPFITLSKWFYCLSFWLLRDNCTNQAICSLDSDSLFLLIEFLMCRNDLHKRGQPSVN